MVVSAALVAATVTVLESALDGAVYRPEVEIVPTVLFPPVKPFTDQVTAVFVVPLTVAENCWVWPTSRDALVGDIPTEMGEAIVTVASADAVETAALTAATVTADGSDFGPPIFLGAVYNPEEETVPTVEFPPPMPLTIQLTAVFDAPVTDPLNCWLLPGCTVAEVGLIETETVAKTVIVA